MSDVQAGPWASQKWATAIYGSIMAGQMMVIPLYGLFLGRFWSHVSDEELWKEHSKRYRAFLCAITGLVTAYALLMVEETCYWGTLQQRSVEVVLRGHAPDAVVTPLGGIISALVSATLAYRASHLFSSRLPKWIFLGVIGALLCTSVAGSLLVMYNAVLLLQDGGASSVFALNHSITLWMSASAAADVSISVALWVNLRSQVGEGFEATDSILRTLAHIGLRTAGYTTILAVSAAGLSAFPQNDYRTTLLGYSTSLPLPCLSCLSLFTTLHSQRTVRDQVTMSFAGNLDSFLSPASVIPGSPRRLHVSMSTSRNSQAHCLVQGTEKEDWKAVVEEREEVAPSKDSDQSPV